MHSFVDDAEIARQSVTPGGGTVDGRRDSTSSLQQLNGASLSPGSSGRCGCAPNVAPLASAAAAAVADLHIGTWNPTPQPAGLVGVAPPSKGGLGLLVGSEREQNTRVNGEAQHFTFGSASSYVTDTGESASTGLCVPVCGRERSTLGAIDEEQQSCAGSGSGVGAGGCGDGSIGICVGPGHSANESGFISSPAFPAHHHHQQQQQLPQGTQGQGQGNASEQQGNSRIAIGRLRYNSGPAAFSHALNPQPQHSFQPITSPHLAPTSAYLPDLPGNSLLDQLFVCSNLSFQLSTKYKVSCLVFLFSVQL